MANLGNTTNHPLKYNREDLVPRICNRLAMGEPLAIIQADLGIPGETITSWRKTDPDIAKQFHDARDLGFDVIAHGTRETARGRGDSTNDVQRDKMIIENDLKLLAKWDPRRYGDKHIIAGDPENPLVMKRDKYDMTDAELLAIAAAASKKAKP